MAFYGCNFIFEDVCCAEYGLMIYDFDSHGQEDVSFKNGSVVEDRPASRYDALMYGINPNEALEYTLVFGANEKSIDSNAHIERYEVEAVAAWLMGHSTRKWLTIVQDDMEAVRYLCNISDLKLITYGDMPWVFSCRVTCDSPYAYMMPDEYEYDVEGEKTVNFQNRSSHNGYYRPDMKIVCDGGDVSVTNESDGNRVFEFKGLPANTGLEIYIDNKNQIITNSLGINLYPYFNMKFFRLIRGENILKIKGDCRVSFICEFPVNIGG